MWGLEGGRAEPSEVFKEIYTSTSQTLSLGYSIPEWTVIPQEIALICGHWLGATSSFQPQKCLEIVLTPRRPACSPSKAQHTDKEIFGMINWRTQRKILVHSLTGYEGLTLTSGLP